MVRKAMVNRLHVNSSRHYLAQFAQAAGQSVPAGALVLDAGAGSCPYKPYFAHTQYESADFCQLERQYGQITYVCDLTQIPVEDGRFDLVFCSQVLEHVPEPAKMLAELNRVLKPGGTLWLSAPLFYEEHDRPYDFYRYTQYGFRFLLEQAKFTVVQMNWMEGYFGTLAYQLAVAYRSLPTRPRAYGGGVVGWVASAAAFPLKFLFAGLSLLYARLDMRHRYTGAGQNKNYTVVAQKPHP